MATPNLQTIVDSTQFKCYLCAGANLAEATYAAELAQISLLKNAANDVSPQGLANQAACINCQGYFSMGGLFITVLLWQIANT